MSTTKATFEAVYKDGVFRPLNRPRGVHEDDTVQLTLESATRPKEPVTDDWPLKKVFGTMSDEDAREMMRVIDEEFGKINPATWK